MLKVFQAGTSLGSSNPGTEMAPVALLEGGLLKALAYNEIDVEVLQPVEHPPASDKLTMGLRNLEELVTYCGELFGQITSNVQKDDKVLTIGGDHSIGMATMLASKRLWPKAHIVYIDAHPDCINDPADTPSGNVHGFPLSTALGDGLHVHFGHEHFGYDDVTLIGVKDIDKAEFDYLHKHGICYYTMDDIIERGIGDIMATVRKRIADRPLHVALDIDSIDVSEAPGTGIINKGGLSYREISYITRQLAEENVRSIDLVEINPNRDERAKTVDLGVELGVTLLGGDWTPYTRYLVQNRTSREA